MTASRFPLAERRVSPGVLTAAALVLTFDARQQDDPRRPQAFLCADSAGELDSVIHVPVQAVFQDAGETICFVREGDAAEPVQVEVGADNAKWVEIKAGLEEGQTVLLVPPRGFIPSAIEASAEAGSPSAEGGAREVGSAAV